MGKDLKARRELTMKISRGQVSKSEAGLKSLRQDKAGMFWKQQEGSKVCCYLVKINENLSERK